MRLPDSTTQHSSPQSSRGQQGFTMVEVLVSVAILAIGLSSVLPVYFYAKASLNESHLRSRANFILSGEFDRISTFDYEEIGSDDLMRQVGNLGETGEKLFHYKIGSDIAFGRYDVPDSLSPGDREELEQREFEVRAQLYYNWELSPTMKYVHLTVSWIPNLRALRSDGGGVNLQTVERLIPISEIVVPDDF